MEKKDPRVIAVIPARGGSKGIPKKNIRFLIDKPLIAYTILAAINSKYIDKLVVSTDDKAIKETANFFGAQVIDRPKTLSQDSTPLDPVIFHAINTIEHNENTSFDFVITIQPTSPLLTTEIINRTIKIMIEGDYDTLISIIGETHLYWIKKSDTYIPLYKKRVNRQELEPIFKETGSILISKRNIVTEHNRIGNKIIFYELSEEKGIDIDTEKDWWIAENLLRKKKIVIRVEGSYELGLGHIYRMISIANKLLLYHDIIFLMERGTKLGIEKIKEYNCPITYFTEKSFFKKIDKINPDIVINDILNTEKKYVLELKKRGLFVVNFEDEGSGAKYADLVINALYHKNNPPKHHYYGYKYVCLADEFLYAPKKEVQLEIKNILITFGGTDSNNLTLRTLKAIEKINKKNISINVILGLGYKYKKDLFYYIDELIKKGFFVQVKENIPFMAREIYNADIVITSNGRTIYEVVAIGTPCISISQNKREANHIFVQTSSCIKYLGLVDYLTTGDISQALSELIGNYPQRKKMSRKALTFDINKGTHKVINLIFDNF